jgi:hypothetical protein
LFGNRGGTARAPLSMFNQSGGLLSVQILLWSLLSASDMS